MSGFDLEPARRRGAAFVDERVIEVQREREFERGRFPPRDRILPPNNICCDNPIEIEARRRGTTYFGERALETQRRTRQFGFNNSAFGHAALAELRPLISENTAFGSNCLTRNNVSENTAFGAYCCENTTASKNTAMGQWAMRYVDGGYDNVAVGSNSMAGTDDPRRPPERFTSGCFNTCLGSGTMQHFPEGHHNVAIGYRSMHTIRGMDARHNVGVGSRTLISIKGQGPSEGYGNAVVGSDSCAGLTKGSFNSCLGIDTGAAIRSGRHNTLLGAESNVGGNRAHEAQYRTALGAGSRVDHDHTIILGRTFGTQLDRVGIRTAAPQAALHVNTGSSLTELPAILAETFGNVAGDAFVGLSLGSGAAVRPIGRGTGAALHVEGSQVWTGNVFRSPEPVTNNTIFNLTPQSHVVVITNGTVPANSIVNLPNPAFVQPGRIFTVRNSSTMTVTVQVFGSAGLIIPFAATTPQFNDVIATPVAATYMFLQGLYYRIQ